MNKSSILGGVIGGLIGAFLWQHLMFIVIVGSFILYIKIGTKLTKAMYKRNDWFYRDFIDGMPFNIAWPIGLFAAGLDFSDLGIRLPKLPFTFRSPIVKTTDSNNSNQK